jgi:hypothetical protein
LRVRPTPERPLSPWVISTVSQSPEAIAAAAWRTWIMNEQPPTAVPSTHSDNGDTIRATIRLYGVSGSTQPIV